MNSYICLYEVYAETLYRYIMLSCIGHNEEVESNLLSKEAVERRLSLWWERYERPSTLDNIKSFLLVAHKNGHDELFTVLSEFKQAEILRLRISTEQNGLLLG